jgi:hypothetical protein
MQLLDPPEQVSQQHGFAYSRWARPQHCFVVLHCVLDIACLCVRQVQPCALLDARGVLLTPRCCAFQGKLHMYNTNTNANTNPKNKGGQTDIQREHPHLNQHNPIEYTLMQHNTHRWVLAHRNCGG